MLSCEQAAASSTPMTRSAFLWMSSRWVSWRFLGEEAIQLIEACIIFHDAIRTASTTGDLYTYTSMRTSTWTSMWTISPPKLIASATSWPSYVVLVCGPGDFLQFYTTFVRPTVEYAAPVWHAGITAKQCDQLEAIHPTLLTQDHLSQPVIPPGPAPYSSADPPRQACQPVQNFRSFVAGKRRPGPLVPKPAQ